MIRCCLCRKPAFDLYPSAPLCWSHCRTWAWFERKPVLEIAHRTYADAEGQVLAEFLARVKAVRPRLGRKVRRLITNLDSLTVAEAEIYGGFRPEETEFLAGILEEILTATGVSV